MKLFGNRPSGGEHTERASGSADAEIEVSEIRSDGAGDEAGTAASGAARKRALRRTCIIIGAVVVALGAVVGAYFLWERRPEAAVQETQTPAQPDGPAAPGPTDGPDAPGDEGPGEDVDENEGMPVLPMTAGRRDGVYTFLLVGTDRASNSTDTILVVTFDTKAHTIDCVSIPRDTLINISWAGTPKKINAVYPGYFNTYNGNPSRYADYDSPEAYGVYGLREHIRKLLGFYVDYYVVVDIQAVEDVVDTIGGVEFDVMEDMVYYDPAQDLAIEIWAGHQVLSGADAVKLCRFRHTYAAGDLKRIEVQQTFLKAMARQLISAKSIPHLGELLDIMAREVDTDLETANVAWLARQFLACSLDDITFRTMPLTASGGGINDVSLVGVDVNAWLELVNGALNPFEADVALENMDLLTYNAYGSVYATTGAIAGGIDSFYCLSCTAKTGHTVYHAPGAHLHDETEEPEETPEATAPPSETGGEAGGETGMEDEPTAAGPVGESGLEPAPQEGGGTEAGSEIPLWGQG